MGLIQNKVTVSQPNSHVIVKNAGGLRGLTGPQGVPGPQGEPGEAATVTAGTTTTLPAGSDATVQNVGSTSDAIFNFGIPQGEKGDTGDTGAAATIEVGSTTTLPTGQDATVTNSGSSSAAVFNFGIPRGPQGEEGPQGFSPSASVSKTGDTATITITDKDGTTTAQITDGVTPTVDDALSPTSENPVQNKVVTNALAGKQPSFQIVDELPAEGVEGSEYLVDEAYETITQLQGGTDQTTYSGKNLFNINDEQKPNTRCVGTVVGESITITSTVNSTGYYCVLIPNSDDLLGKSVTLSISNVDTNTTGRVYVNNADKTNLASVSGSFASVTAISSGTSVTKQFTFPSSYASGKDCFVITFYASNNTSSTVVGDYTTFSNVQLELGSTATDYEPYTGGIASPNPDYPQQVNSATGRQTVYMTGKNLAKPYQTSGSITANGVTMTMNSNGSITLDGTATGNSWLEFVGGFTSIPAQLYTPVIPLDKDDTYTFSYSIASGSISGGTPSIWIQYDTPEDSSARETHLSITASGDSKSFTGKTGVYRMWIRSSAGHKYNNLVLQAQVERGSIATNFKPYQGQSYEVNLGKNLVDKDNATYLPGYFEASGTITYGVTSRNRVLYIPCEPNVAYSITRPTGSWAGGSWTIANCRETPAYGVPVYRAVSIGNNATLGNYVTDSDSKYLVLRCQTADSTTYAWDNEVGDTGLTVWQTVLAGLQIEKGPVATEYAAYFTPIELCKIGDYQDYIYKSGEDWYIHKAIATQKYTGASAESWQKFEYSGISMWRSTVIPSGMDETAIATDSFRANNATYWVNDGTSVSSALSEGEFGFNAAASNLNIKWNAITTLSDWESWLTSNPMIVYYPLSTATDTKITNSALIAQLEALNAVAVKHYNIVTVSSQNLPTSLVLVQGANSHLEPYVYYNGKFEKVQIV